MIPLCLGKGLLPFPASPPRHPFTCDAFATITFQRPHAIAFQNYLQIGAKCNGRRAGDRVSAFTTSYLPTISRFAGAIVGGYVFAFGLVAAGTLVGLNAGLSFDEAQSLAYLLGFIAYLVALLWAFTPKRTLWVWLALGGGGLAMSAAAWAITRLNA